MAVVADEVVIVVKSDVSRAIAGLSAVANKAQSSFKKVGAAATRAGTKLTMGLTLPIVGVGIAAFKLGIDAQDAFASLEANAGVPRAVLDDLEQDLFDIASVMGVSIPEAADAFFMVWSAGQHDPEKALADMNSVLMAVNANLGESGDLAQVGAVAFVNMGLDFEHTYDVLTAAAGAAIVGPAEMGKAFMRVLGPAGLAGMSIEDMAINLTFLTNTFGNADRAGTGLEGVILKILKVAPSGADALDMIGLSAKDLQDMVGKNGLQATLKDLDGVFEGIGMGTDEWIAAIFPDQQAFLAAKAILEGEMGGIADSINGSEGALSDAFAVVERTASFQLGQAVATIKNFGAEIGLELIEMLNPYLPLIKENFDEFSTWWRELSDESKVNVFKIVAAVASLGPALLGLGIALKVLGGGIGLFTAMLGMGPSIAAAWASANAALSGIALGSLAGVAALLAWVVVIAVVVAAIWYFRDEIWAALTFLWEGIVSFTAGHWEQIEKVIYEATQLVQGVIEDVVAFIMPLWEDFVGFIREMTAELTEWWEENWPKIYKIISFVFDKVLVIIEGALQVLQVLWDIFWPYIELVVKNVWEAIKLIIKVAWELISGMFSFWLSVLTGDWEGAWDAILGIVTGIWDALYAFIEGVIGNVVDMVMGYVDTMKERFGEGFTEVKDTVTGIFSDMWSGIKDGFVTAINWLIDKLNSFIRSANSVSSFLNPFGDGFGVSEIPNLGFGGADLKGAFKVGDRGLPEIVNLPGGSTVTPLAPGETGGGGNTIINLNAPQNDPLGIAREVGWELTKRGM